MKLSVKVPSYDRDCTLRRYTYIYTYNNIFIKINHARKEELGLGVTSIDG